MSEHALEAAGASATPPLFPAALEHQWAVQLVTYRHDGTPVSTPVSIVVDGDRAYFRTYDRSGKAARLRHSRRVAVAPSDWRGRATGPAFAATARLLDGPQAARAAQLIDRKYPWFQRVLVRLGHRLRRYRTLHFELTPRGSGDPVTISAHNSFPASGKLLEQRAGGRATEANGLHYLLRV